MALQVLLEYDPYHANYWFSKDPDLHQLILGEQKCFLPSFTQMYPHYWKGRFYYVLLSLFYYICEQTLLANHEASH